MTKFILAFAAFSFATSTAFASPLHFNSGVSAKPFAVATDVAITTGKVSCKIDNVMKPCPKKFNKAPKKKRHHMPRV